MLARVRRHDSRSMASDGYKFNLFKSLSAHSFQVLLPRPLPTFPVTSYSAQRLTQSISSFRCTCPYQRNLFLVRQSTICCLCQVGYITLLENLARTHSPHTRVFSPFQSVEVLLFHRPSLTAVTMALLAQLL